MIKRHYITGDQLFAAYTEVVRQGVKPYIVARRYGLATNTIVRSLDVIQQMLSGKPMNRQKNRAAFDYALAKIQPKPKQSRNTVTVTTVDAIDPYEQLNVAIALLNQAVEEVLIYEVDRRAGEIKKELDFYKEIAHKTNVATTLKKHFEGKL
jgi:hypothetical protein